MSKNAKKAKSTKSRKTAPKAEAEILETATPETPETDTPEAEVFTPAPDAPAPANAEAEPEAEDTLTPVEAANLAAEAAAARLETLLAQHAEISEAVRLGKLDVKATAKTAVRAARPQKGCLEAAYEVLKGWAEPRDSKQIVKEMADRGLWKPTTGVTPWSTLYAGIFREIREKGTAARFARGEKKGTFIANPLFNPEA